MLRLYEHKQSILSSMTDNFQIATLVFLAPCFAFLLPRLFTVRQPAFAAHMRFCQQFLVCVRHTVLQPHAFKTQRIQYNANTAECHCKPCEYRREKPAENGVENTARKRNPYNIVYERPEKILLDSAHCHFGKADCFYQF